MRQVLYAGQCQSVLFSPNNDDEQSQDADELLD